MDGILKSILAAGGPPPSEFDDPGLAPPATPTTLGRVAAGVGLDMLTPGPGAPGLAAMLSAPDEPEVLAWGTDPNKVNQQLHEMGVSPEAADLMMIKDNDSGQWQAVRMKRSNVSDEQAREWREQDAMEAINLEVEARTKQWEDQMKQLELQHSAIIQDFDRSMRLTRDPQMRALWAQSKADAQRYYMQAVTQKQRDLMQMQTQARQVLTEYTKDRYRTGPRPTDEQASLEILRDQLARGRMVQGENLRLNRDLRVIAERAKLSIDELQRDTTVGLYKQAMGEYLSVMGSERTSSSRRQEAEDKYNDLRVQLEAYVDSKFKQKPTSGSAGGNGAGSTGGAEKVLFTTANGVKIVEGPTGPKLVFPAGMSEAGKRRAAAEIRKGYQR